jgi:hypothetical protein
MAIFFLGVITAGWLAAGVIIYPLGEQEPSGFSTNTVSNAVRGWRFQVNSDGVVVDQLGAHTPASDTYPVTVTLFDVLTQDVLAQGQTTPCTGWCWVDLGTPVPLTQGAQYIITMFTGSAPGNQYYYQGSLPSSWYPTGTIEYLDMRYANSATSTTFPTNVLTGFQYGVPDIGYELGGATVPEPGTLGILGLGILMLVGFRWRHTPVR